MPGVGNDTPLFWRSQPGGPATIVNKPEMGTGKFYWVDSAAGAQASNTTGSDQAPCSTVEAAIVLAAAELATNSTVSHTILLKEGHAQSLTAPIALSTAGIKIIALGTLGQRAKLTMITNTTAAFVVTGGNCKIQGIDFVCNVASLTEFIDIAADDLEVCDCTLKEGTQLSLSMITADTTDGVGDNLYVHHNYFTQPTAGVGTSAVEIAKDLRNVRIEYNRMYGDWDDACIEIPADGKDCTELQIHNNHLSNLLTGQHAIQINSTTCTGSITGNFCQTDTQSATIDKSACFASGNMWLDVDGTNDEEAVPVNAAVAGTIAAGNDAVPSTDGTADILIRDVVGKKDDAAAAGAVSTTESLVAYEKQVVTELIVVDGFHDVPTADVGDNAQMRDVVGAKDDAAAAGAVSAVESIMAYAKQLVGELQVVDGFHDVGTPDAATNAQMRDVVGNKTDTSVQDIAADKSALAYLKGILDILAGTAGVATWKTAAAPANAVSMSEGLRYISENQAPRIAVKSTGDLTSFGATAALFTVTGDVWVRAGASMDVAVTSTSGTTTLGIGITGNDACLCVQDTVDNTAFAIGDSWTLATAADANGAVMTGDYVLIGNGSNIILTGNVDDITAGDMDVYVQYIPASTDGAVVAA